MSNTFSTHEAEGFSITTNTQTPDQMAETFKADAPKAEPKDPGAVDSGEENAGATPQTPPQGSQPPVSKHAKPKDSPQARVEQLARQRAEDRRRADEAERSRDEIQRRAEAAEAELQRLKGGGAPKKDEPKPAAAGDPKDPEPSEDDFEDWASYNKAQAKWAARQEFREQQRTADETRQRESFMRDEEQAFQSFSKRIDDAIKADPTLDQRISPDVLSLLPEGPVDPSQKLGPLQALGVFFVKNAKGIQLMEHFSANPEELQRFSALHPTEFWMELGSVVKSLGAASTAPVPEVRVSKAPPPVRPVTAGAPIGSMPDDGEDFANSKYAKERMAEMRKHRR